VTSSAEKLVAQILGDQSTAAQRAVRGIVAGHMTAAQKHALDLLDVVEPVPGTRSVLPIDPFAPPVVDQPQYRRGSMLSAQLRRPIQVQGTTRARGPNSWGAADQRQLGGVRPESSESQ